MGTEQSMTTASRIDYHPIYALERRLADARSLGGLTEISVEELECLLTHLKPVLEENERYREALRDIANAIRCGAETDVMAWARLAEAQKSVARAALSQKGER